MKNLKRNVDGITLISLVVAIIVLLILATISVVALTGENGMLSKAGDIRKKAEKSDAGEQVEMAVLASYDHIGNLDYGKLKDRLNKIPKITGVPDEITKEDFPIKVNVNGYDVKINDEGKVMFIPEVSGNIAVFTDDNNVIGFEDLSKAIKLSTNYDSIRIYILKDYQLNDDIVIPSNATVFVGNGKLDSYKPKYEVETFGNLTVNSKLTVERKIIRLSMGGLTRWKSEKFIRREC